MYLPDSWKDLPQPDGTMAFDPLDVFGQPRFRDAMASLGALDGPAARGDGAEVGKTLKFDATNPVAGSFGTVLRWFLISIYIYI